MALDAGELFERYYGVVYRRCLALLKQPDDAAEAVQEVFTRAVSGLGRFHLRSSPLTWLYAIATRHCLQLLRNRSTQALKHALFVEASTTSEDLASRTDLDRVLSGLTIDELELAAHAFRDGLTQDEISDVTRQSRKTVGKKLKALSEKLQLELRVDERLATVTP